MKQDGDESKYRDEIVLKRSNDHQTTGEKKMSDWWIHDQMQRFAKPDGLCMQCRSPADQHWPVGPITITVATPDDDGDARTHEFCNWRCLAQWAADAGGGVFVIEQS